MDQLLNLTKRLVASMISYFVKQSINLHMVLLVPIPPHHLLLQQNPEMFILLVPVMQVVLEKRPLNKLLLT